ncbi:hypothetical protein C8Q70DRAFT_914030 [Cubamyces menziesii]|nr:hypothetical protein C8Q70DRAFT_914030 [Cubamyces menziesii]
MSLHCLPTELLIDVLMHLRREADRPWLASVALVCRAFKPVIEAILYREAAIDTYQGLRRFCISVVDEPSRGIAVRKLTLNLNISRGPSVDLEPYFEPALRLLINLTSLKIIADDPTILSLLIDAPFRLRTLHVLCSYYPLCFEDAIASHPTLEQLNLRFEEGCAALPPQKSRQGILPNLCTLSTYSEDFLALYGRYTCSNLTCLFLRYVAHQDTSSVFSLLGETLVSVRVSRYIEDECTQSCIWPTSILQNSRLPRLKRLEVHDIPDRTIDYLMPSLDAIMVSDFRDAYPDIEKLIWDPGCGLYCQCELHMPPIDDHGDQTMLHKFAEILLNHFPSMKSIFVAHAPPRDHQDCWLEGDVFERAPDGTAQQPEVGVLYDEDEWEKVR